MCHPLDLKDVIGYINVLDGNIMGLWAVFQAITLGTIGWVLGKDRPLGKLESVLLLLATGVSFLGLYSFMAGWYGFLEVAVEHRATLAKEVLQSNSAEFYRILSHNPVARNWCLARTVFVVEVLILFAIIVLRSDFIRRKP